MRRNIPKIFLTTALAFSFTLNAAANGPGQSSSSSVVYAGATEITSAATQSGKTYSTSTSDESALLIDTSSAVTIINPTVTKTGSSNGGDNCNFYGQNAAVLVKGGSTTTITGGTIKSAASGANGVFSYGGNGGTNGADGDGTTVNISNTTITTTGSGSGGIMTTGGGVTNATNLTVTTSGGSSAPIRTDRGGGTVNVKGGTYTANGLGSPAIYSTADVSVSGAKLISNLSEGVCIEGKNSIDLTNCTLTASNKKRNGNATFLDTVMIYQSMSGDSDSGTSSFTMTGGTLNSTSGHVFHVTNTSGVITLKGVTINNTDGDNILLSVCDDGWSGGSNTAVLNGSGQALEGGILVGSDSTLTMKLTDSSSFSGYVSGKISNASGKTVSSSVGTVAVTLDSTSKWTLTADSYITSFTGDASNVISNGHTLYVNGTALSGTTSSSGTTTSTNSSTTSSTTDSSTSSSTDSSTSSTTDSSTSSSTDSSSSSSTTSSTTSSSSSSSSTAKKVTISKKPVIKKTAAKKTSIAVYWNKINSKTAYGKKLLKKIKYVQVQYSTNKKFKNAVTKKAGKTKNKLTLTGLKKNTTYYVRVRYFGKNGVSKWSTIKKVKTKKK